MIATSQDLKKVSKFQLLDSNRPEIASVKTSSFSPKKEQIIYENKGRYTGAVDSQRRPHGIGKFEFLDDSVYIGEFKNGAISGKGCIEDESIGYRYKGDWLNWEKNGPGIEEITKKGKTEIFEGRFKNDLREGYGKLIYRNGDTYTGYFAEGKRNGHGILNWVDGQKYEGNWVRGKMYGQGRMEYANGDWCAGFFKEEGLDGDGKYYNFEKRELYSGGFNRGKRHGLGVLTDNVNDSPKNVLYDRGNLI